jgi:hypothetical protein
MSTEALRSQIRSIVQGQLRQGVNDHASAGPSAIVVPLQINSAQDLHLLTQLVQRLAASPALAQAAAAGLIRLDIAVGQGIFAACGEACQAEAPAALETTCACPAPGQAAAASPDGSTAAAPAAELAGLVSEKTIRKLSLHIRQVTLAANAIVTPLGRDELKRRGITLLSTKKG